jgi:hypothetical protein
MTYRKTLEQLETRVGNYEVTLQDVAYCKIAYERDRPKEPTVVHEPLGITYHPNEQANAIVDCLENHFTSHDLCNENHKRQVETGVQALLASVDDTPL